MEKRLNVLWICTDQQRADTLGCYGNTRVRTPNIDRLAAEGAQFDNCFAQSPVCCPSRASFMTGRYPRTTGLRQNGQILPEGEMLISRLFADAGYDCGLVGKFHMAPGAPEVTGTVEQRGDDGFQEFNWAQAPSNLWGLHSDYTRFLADQGLEFTLPPSPHSDWIRQGMPKGASEVEWVATRTTDFISRNADGQPWFYMANIFSPHHPFNPPERFLERYLGDIDSIPLPDALDDDLTTKTRYQQIDAQGAYGETIGFGKGEMTDTDHRMVKAAYWAMCDHIDEEVGRIMEALKASGQADNTLVVFMSDHGEMLGDHGIYLKGPYFYDAAIRVPLIIHCPGNVRPASYSSLFELVHLAPTLLEAANLPRYEGMQGNSAFPTLERGAGALPGDDSVYSEYYNAMPFHTDPTAQLTMLRTRTHKIVVDHAHDDGELYDLVNDPLERVNLWNDPAAIGVKVDLLVRLTHRMAFTVDPLPERLSEW